MAQTPHDATYYLGRYWGYSQFRPLQAEIIQAVMQGHDTLALLPTGGGKSLCYQLPAVALEGICVVISPLIALMKDQVEHLKRRGIKAACLTSGMTGMEQTVVLNNSLYGGTKILYVSPERLRNKTFLGHLRQMQLSLIAVDEAHCISQWGHDFRPTYLQIADIRKYHPHTPVLALTATATQPVVEEIQHNLLMRQPRLFRNSFRRSNLAYRVVGELDKTGRLVQLLQADNGCAIVYVRNRRRCQQVATLLNHEHISATYYHAGLTPQERDRSQSQWMNGQVSVIVATNAFGMGIDKADVRQVIHLDLPDSLEAYFQEAGRAGRDGMPATATILYDDHDLTALQQAHAESFPLMEQIRSIYNAVCNYYQIPIGSGQDCSFDLDLGELCQTYQLKPTMVYAALQHLERIGLVSIPGREEHTSRLHICSNRETLYRFEVDQPRYATLIDSLLRTYGGLFTSFVNIYERQLARLCDSDVATVEKMLLHLDALKLVSYRRHSDKPQIGFPTYRVDDSVVGDSDGVYRQLESMAQRRLDAVKAYVENRTQCRSALLLDYFGETQDAPCGQCDICRADAVECTDYCENDLIGAILDLLHQEPRGVAPLTAALRQHFNQLDDKRLEQLVRRLLDERRIGMGDDFKLHV